MTVFRFYRWRLTPKTGEQLDDLARRARKALAWACDGDKRITCMGVSGEAIGVVEIEFSVKARDLWWCGQLGQDIINIATKRLAEPVGVDIHLEDGPIHDHRGYAYGRTRRINQPRGRRQDRAEEAQPTSSTPPPTEECSQSPVP